MLFLQRIRSETQTPPGPGGWGGGVELALAWVFGSCRVISYRILEGFWGRRAKASGEDLTNHETSPSEGRRLQVVRTRIRVARSHSATTYLPRRIRKIRGQASSDQDQRQCTATRLYCTPRRLLQLCSTARKAKN